MAEAVSGVHQQVLAATGDLLTPVPDPIAAIEVACRPGHPSAAAPAIL
jgi:hypothetical protein